MNSIGSGQQRAPFAGTTAVIDGLGAFNLKIAYPDTIANQVLVNPEIRRIDYRVGPLRNNVNLAKFTIANGEFTPNADLDNAEKLSWGRVIAMLAMEGLPHESQSSYWRAWAQRVEFAKISGRPEWLNPAEGGSRGRNMIEFLLYRTQTIERMASTVRSNVAEIWKTGNLTSPHMPHESKPTLEGYPRLKKSTISGPLIWNFRSGCVSIWPKTVRRISKSALPLQ